MGWHHNHCHPISATSTAEEPTHREERTCRIPALRSNITCPEPFTHLPEKPKIMGGGKLIASMTKHIQSRQPEKISLFFKQCERTLAPSNSLCQTVFWTRRLAEDWYTQDTQVSSGCLLMLIVTIWMLRRPIKHRKFMKNDPKYMVTVILKPGQHRLLGLLHRG